MRGWSCLLVSSATLLALTSAAPAESVKFGAIYTLSGPGPVVAGEGAMKGTELAISKVNDAGGLKNHGGAKIELIRGDTQSKPINAVGEAERMITQEGVALILGATISNETIPLSQITEKYGVVHINSIPQAARLTDGTLKWTWSTTLVDSDYVTGIFRALDMVRGMEPKLTRVSVLCPDNEYGLEMGKEIKAEFAKRSDLILAAFIEYGAQSQDLLQPVLKVKAARPDVVVQVGYFRAGVLASKAYEQLDFHPIVIGTGGMSGDPKLRTEIGNLVQWQFAVTPFSADLPGAKRVGEEFQQKYNEPLTLNSALAYFAAYVAAKGVDGAKSFQSDDIAAALRSIKISKEEMITSSDFLQFDGNGRNKGRNTTLTQFQGDRLVTVWPPEEASAKPILKGFNTP